jgi:AcrR family transcriptional regulator
LKTRERILLVARELFNEQGEHNVAASDIALAMDISPGNLYYHFKGKDAIHLALFATLQRDLIGLLGTGLTQPSLFSDNQDSPIMRSWFFLTVVLEKMLAYRYLYDNLADLMHRFPEIDRGVRRLGRLKIAACDTLIAELLPASNASPERVDSLVDTMAMTLTFWLSWDQMTHNDDRSDIIVHRGVLQLLSCCAPYMGDEQQSFYAECEVLYREMVATTQ